MCSYRDVGDAIPYTFFFCEEVISGMNGTILLVNGMSAPRTSVCFARTPSPIKIPSPGGRGQGEGNKIDVSISSDRDVGDAIPYTSYIL